MQSKFTNHAYMHLLWLFFATLMLYVNFTTEQEFNSIFLYIVPILLIVNLYAIFNRYRTKIISIYIDNEVLKIKRFCGLGIVSLYQIKELEGYYVSEVGLDNDQYLLIIYKGKIIAKISDKYHSNFNGLSQKVCSNLEDLGYRNTNIFTEIKDSFVY